MYQVKTTPTYIEMQTEEHGLLKLRDRLLVSDLIAIEDLEHPTGRAFTVLALSRLIDSSSFDTAGFDSWDDELLTLIVKTWAEKKQGSKWELKPDLDIFDTFYQCYKDETHFDEVMPQAHKHEEKMLEQFNMEMSQEFAQLGSTTKALQTELAFHLNPLQNIDISNLIPKFPDYDFIGAGFSVPLNMTKGMLHSLVTYPFQYPTLQPMIDSLRLPLLDSFGSSLAMQLERLVPVVPNLHMNVQQIGEQVASLVSRISETLQKSTETLLPQPLFSMEFSQGMTDSFKYLQPALRQFMILGDAANALDAGGYVFLFNYSSQSELSRFAEINHVDTRVQSAVLTNTLLNISRQQSFAQEMKFHFLSSRMLKPRWETIEPALEAHKNKNYALSIPALFAQIEGIYTDLLIRHGLFWFEKESVYGTNKEGKKIKLIGLKLKLTTSIPHIDSPLKEVAEFLLDYLADRRNSVLHGSDLAYHRPKLSLQLILLTSILAGEVVVIEAYQQ